MRLCDVDGCERKHRARGYCSTHYNELVLGPTKRHSKHAITCETCGETWQSTRKAGRFCSIECRDAGHWNASPMSTELVHVGIVPFSWLPARHPVNTYVKPRKPHVWYAGTCPRCGDSFLDWQPQARYCSRRCAGEKARLRLAIEQRLGLYERDAWTCWLCDGSVDPLLSSNDDFAPSLDHVIPRAHGGSDDPSNLRLAHRWCNSVRSDESYYSRLDLSPVA